MTHAIDVCPPCDHASSPPSRIKPFLARLLARLPRRLDAVDLERTSKYLLRDIGLSE
jgi:hypothetical protein